MWFLCKNDFALSSAQFLLIRNSGEVHRNKHILGEYLPHLWLDLGFKSTVVNCALLSLHGGSLEILLTVPLMAKYLALENPMISFLKKKSCPCGFT